jgi:phosphopentomutase
MIRPGNIGTFMGFCCLGKTLADLYGVDDEEIEGSSFAALILK